MSSETELEVVRWGDGTFGANSTTTKLNTGNELASISWTFDPPLENVTHVNFSGLTGNWSKGNSNRSQLRIRAMAEDGSLVWSASGNHINGGRTTAQAFKSLTYNLGGVQVAQIYFARQRSRAIKFSAVTTNQPASASFTLMHVPTEPSISSVVSLSNSIVVNINNVTDGLVLSVGDLDFDVTESEVIVDELEPNTTYNVILKSTEII